MCGEVQEIQGQLKSKLFLQFPNKPFISNNKHIQIFYLNLFDDDFNFKYQIYQI